MNLAQRMLIASLLSAASLASAQSQEPPKMQSTAANALAGESGLATVYSERLDGHVTASGQKYDPTKLTAAHKTLPFGTRVKVTNVKNGKSVVVRINDRGPRQAGRVLDLSPRAARALGMRRLGMAEVSLEVQN